jgi:hypothetical protein
LPIALRTLVKLPDKIMSLFQPAVEHNRYGRRCGGPISQLSRYELLVACRHQRSWPASVGKVDSLRQIGPGANLALFLVDKGGDIPLQSSTPALINTNIRPIQ